MSEECKTCGQLWSPSRYESDSFPGSACDLGECMCMICEEGQTPCPRHDRQRADEPVTVGRVPSPRQCEHRQRKVVRGEWCPACGAFCYQAAAGPTWLAPHGESGLPGPLTLRTAEGEELELVEFGDGGPVPTTPKELAERVAMAARELIDVPGGNHTLVPRAARKPTDR
jgi:hypothetical protein